ncbi:MAG: hydrogenase expression/formation protein HypE [Planctomycetia bacterium]|nr:hydrogenase expression/formation protein HypE [Planctomycetia bacterium]
MSNPIPFSSSCPVPLKDYPHIISAHGSGGKLMHELIEKMFVPAFGATPEFELHDSTVVNLPGSRIAFTTDSYVVRPLFFPGGDIGKLAVNGTVNDLAMSGARPLFLSLGFILEEGLLMETLWRVVQSVREAAHMAQVRIITGDTKVVDKGKGDGIFINTAGIGIIEHQRVIAPSALQTGDVIILNGDIARHGMAIMAVREGMEFESAIESDCAPLAGLVGCLLSEGIEIHCMRDLTRGGLATSLKELAVSSGKGVRIDETLIPVREDVASACEILGLDPLYVANEGRFVCFVPGSEEKKTIEIMRRHPLGLGACVIGEVRGDTAGLLTLKKSIGSVRILDMLAGDQLPRIC